MLVLGALTLLVSASGRVADEMVAPSTPPIPSSPPAYQRKIKAPGLIGSHGTKGTEEKTGRATNPWRSRVSYKFLLT
jgi:hypothetical protein